MPKYGAHSKGYLEDIMENIRESVDNAWNKAMSGPNNQFSIDIFVQHLKSEADTSIFLTESDCQLLVDHKVVNGEAFLELLTTKINQIEEDILKTFQEESASTVSWVGQAPHEQVMEKIWGCKETCPFCRSPCVYTSADHIDNGIKHKCLLHWPEGFSGTRSITTDKLDIDICNFTITTGAVFQCAVSGKKCRESGNCTAQGDNNEKHPYKEYKKYLLDWDIDPDPTGSASHYWQWAMYTYQTQLTEHYKTQPPDVPSGWKISKEEAIESLYKLSTENSVQQQKVEITRL